MRSFQESKGKALTTPPNEVGSRSPEGQSIFDLFKAFDEAQRQVACFGEWVSSQREAGALPPDLELPLERLRREHYDFMATICYGMIAVPSTDLREVVMKAKALLWLLPEDGDASDQLARSHCVDLIRLGGQAQSTWCPGADG